MELEDIPIPPTSPSSSTGFAASKEDGGGVGNPTNDAWRKAQEALQKVHGSSGTSGKNQNATTSDVMTAGGVYNSYLQSYPWAAYPNYAAAATSGSYPPWMQSAYASWAQQGSAAAGFQPFGFNSAPTALNASQSTSSPSGSFSDQSSSESVISPSVRGSFRQQGPARALLGDRPSGPVRRGLGYGGRGVMGGPIRFGFRRGGGGPPRFVPASDSASSGNGNLSFEEDRSGVQDDGADEDAKQGKMPKNMEAYVERAFADAETPEKKTQVEQALKQYLLPLLHTGEAFRTDWDNEPLPTDTRFAVRLLQANLRARGRGGSSYRGNLLSSRGRGGGGFLKPEHCLDHSLNVPTIGIGNAQQQANTENLAQRGRGGFALRGRGQRGAFNGRLPLLFRSKSRSRSIESIDETGSKDGTEIARRRRRNTSSSEDGPRKRGRGSFAGRRNSTSSVESETFGFGRSKKDRAAAKKKKNKKGQKKRFPTEDVDNDDQETDGYQNQSTTNGKKKKKAMKFSMDKHQTKSEQEVMKRQRAMRFAEHIAPQASKKPTKSLASRLGKRPGNNISYIFDDRSNSPDSSAFDYEFDPAAFLIIGTCETLEKPYLRLTTVPDPSQVRPEPVLVKALAMVKQKWKERGDYRYVCDQLKSIRQDMTIQCIRNRFSVDVYETHARIALEKGDREEFNQCQSQLKALYVELPGCQNEYEFTAYRLLFYVYMENTMDITTILAHLTPEMRKEECIRFALQIRHAWSLRDYYNFFKLSRSGRPPRMCSYVLDLFMERERKRALKALLKAFRPALPISYIAETLSFELEEDCVEFLRQLQVPFLDEDESKVDCRQTMPTF